MAVALMIYMLVGVLLETLGIGLIIPALSIITDTSFIDENKYINLIIDYLNEPTQEQLIIYGMLLIALVYALKVIYMVFYVWKQAAFTYELQTSLSLKLFSGYLNKSYVFHLYRNSANLIRNITNEVGILTKSAHSALVILSELLVFLSISALLIFIEPAGAMVIIIILGMSGFLFYKFTKSYVYSLGEARHLHDGLRIQHIQQGLGGIKDILLLGRQLEFEKKYQKHNIASANAGKFWAVIQALPRYFLELCTVISLVILVYITLSTEDSLNHLVPILGVFVAAAFRVMPSINRIVNAFQNLRYGLPAIDKVYNEIISLKPDIQQESDQHIKFETKIELNEVSFKYPSMDINILDKLSLKISKGECIAFIGTTGTGKTTLIDIILGLLKPDSGTINVDDVNIHENIRSWQDQIGYVPQSIYLSDDTLLRNIAFGLSDEKINETAVWNTIDAANLRSFIDSLPDGLNTIVGERGVRLSGGQKQRIGIARALYYKPKVLVLDEATSSLDNETEKAIMDSVRKLRGSKTIIIVAHRLTTVEYCDSVYELNNRNIVYNKPVVLNT
jgi:ATP-binding cassette, subfamily B, bacterial PglK